MTTGQQSLATGAKRATRNQDYVKLFDVGVFPTGDIDILERGDSLLVIKSIEWTPKLKIPKAQERIWRNMVRLGKIADGQMGEVVVVCVMGLGHLPRVWVEFSQRYPDGKTTAGTVEDWRAYLRDWWTTHRGYR